MNRSLIAKICTIAVILGIAACMFVIGRGHTVYFDAKPIEYNGETVEPGYRTAIFVNDERVATRTSSSVWKLLRKQERILFRMNFRSSFRITWTASF